MPPGVRYALDAKYRGQKFGDTALAILGFFDEKAILKPTQRKVDDGSPHDPHELTAAANVVTVLTLKDDPSKSWSCAAGRIICTRLLEHVLASAKVPDDKKLQLVDTAKTSAASKKWKAEYDEKRAIATAPTEEKKLSAAELGTLTPAERNARRRQQTLQDRTVQKLGAAQIVAIQCFGHILLYLPHSICGDRALGVRGIGGCAVPCVHVAIIWTERIIFDLAGQAL